MKRTLLFLALLASFSVAAQESYVQLPPNSTGSKLRMRCNTISANLVCSQGFFLDDGAGSGALGVSSNPIFVQFAAAATAAVTQSGAWSVSVSSSALPTGASTSAKQDTGNTSIASVDTKLGEVQASPTANTVLARLKSIEDKLSALQTELNQKTEPADTQPVSGTFWPVTQPVSGTFWQATQPVSGTFWQATQPVSASSLPLPSGASTLAEQQTQTTSLQVMDDTQVATGTTAPAKINIAGGKTSDGTPQYQPIPLTNGGAAVKVDGSASTQPISGTISISQTTTANDVDANVTNFPSAFTANAGTNLNTSALALDATLTGGSQKAIVRGGAKGATSAADVTSTANGADHQALDVWMNNSSIAVTGTFWQATQPVSGTFWQATQPVSISGNQAVNQTQVNGVAVSVGSGVTDTGTQRVTLSQDATYSAGTTAATATAAGTGVFFSICGSATKTIRIQRFTVSGTAATGAKNGDVILTKTSTATSGGTATTLTQVPYDSNSAAGTATNVKYYTVLGTTGTSVGVVGGGHLYLPLTGTGTFTQPVDILWRDQDAESPTLRGTTQCMQAAFGATTTNAPTLFARVVWTEK